MACTNHQPWSLELQVRQEKFQHSSYDLLWKDYLRDHTQSCDNYNSKVRPGSSIQLKSVKKFLWIDCFCNPSSVVEQLQTCAFVAPTRLHDGDPCDNNEDVTHNKTLLCKNEAMAFVSFLRSCARSKDLHRGTRIHEDILRRGLLEKCSDALVTMYAKCGALAKAKELLEVHKSRNVSAWTALIVGYTQQGQYQNALNCFQQMKHEGLSPNPVTFSCILRACGSLKAIKKGEQIHDEIARQGLLENDIVLGNALVDMYVKCNALSKAQRILEDLPLRDVVSWNTLIAGYAQQEQGELALKCFDQMQEEGFSPDAVTFISVLKACGCIKAATRGEQIHDKISQQGLLQSNMVLGTALVDMYAKCGVLGKARQVLEDLPSRNVISWNALIGGYNQQGQGEQALNCFEQMQQEDLSPDAVTFACSLKACGIIGAADKGEQIHDEITRQGLLKNSVVLGTALVDMYAKCGDLAKAQQVLKELPSRDVVSWNALIAGCVQQGQGEQALNCFEEMQSEGISPNGVTFACISKVCGTLGAIDKGDLIYDEISRQGLLGSNIVLGTALVDMYAKGGALTKAQRVLEDLPLRDAVSWSALIAGCAEQGEGEKALWCFEQMQREGLSADIVTFACVLKACGTIGAIDKGEKIHDEIDRWGLLENSLLLGNALVDMYAKCGALGKARQVLEELPIRDVVSWSALIAGYAQQGQGEQALDCFVQMQDEGFSPDALTFSSVLNACSHLGLIEDGHMYFESMSTKYGITPDIEHFTCMVDLFGRAGHLDRAIRVIQEMPSSNYLSVWSALLSACQKWGDVNVGRWAFEQAVQVDKSDAATYILMANIYSAAGMQHYAERIEAARMENRAWRKSGG